MLGNVPVSYLLFSLGEAHDVWRPEPKVCVRFMYPHSIRLDEGLKRAATEYSDCK